MELSVSALHQCAPGQMTWREGLPPWRRSHQRPFAPVWTKKIKKCCHICPTPFKKLAFSKLFYRYKTTKQKNDNKSNGETAHLLYINLSLLQIVGIFADVRSCHSLLFIYHFNYSCTVLLVLRFAICMRNYREIWWVPRQIRIRFTECCITVTMFYNVSFPISAGSENYSLRPRAHTSTWSTNLLIRP